MHGQSRPAPAPEIRILEGKPLDKNTLRWVGKVAIALAGGAEIVIGDVMVFKSGDRCWASLPSWPVIRDGQHVIDETGKKQYVPIIVWDPPEMRFRFSDAVIAAVREHFPDALGHADGRRQQYRPAPQPELSMPWDDPLDDLGRDRGAR